MLSYQDDNSDYEEPPYRKAKTLQEPKKEEEVWHQILSRQGSGVETRNEVMLDDFVEVYSVRDLLGVGAYGVVLQVKNKITNERSALKIIPKEKLSNAALSILKNESSIMSHMSHPSVVAFKRIFENQKFIILEMELVVGG
jgi:serine/threonine protein kinase